MQRRPNFALAFARPGGSCKVSISSVVARLVMIRDRARSAGRALLAQVPSGLLSRKGYIPPSKGVARDQLTDLYQELLSAPMAPSTEWSTSHRFTDAVMLL